MGSTVAAEERAAKAIALSCSMQAAENVMRGRRSSPAQMEAAVYEINAVERPSRALVSVCLALLTVIDYSAVVTEMEKREWGVPVDPTGVAVSVEGHSTEGHEGGCSKHAHDLRPFVTGRHLSRQLCSL